MSDKVEIDRHVNRSSAVGAGDAEEIFLGKIWAIFGQICAKVIKIWVNLIRFGQNQNLASEKRSISYCYE